MRRDGTGVGPFRVSTFTVLTVLTLFTSVLVSHSSVFATRPRVPLVEERRGELLFWKTKLLRWTTVLLRWTTVLLCWMTESLQWRTTVSVH